MSQAEGQRWMRSQQGQFKKRRGEEREKCEERCRYAEREIKERHRGRQRVKDKMETMADWVTSLLAVTGQCCIAGTRTRRKRRRKERIKRSRTEKNNSSC